MLDKPFHSVATKEGQLRLAIEFLSLHTNGFLIWVVVKNMVYEKITEAVIEFIDCNCDRDAFSEIDEDRMLSCNVDQSVLQNFK